MRKLAYITPLILLIVSACTSGSGNEQSASETDSTLLNISATERTALPEGFSVEGDSLILPPFEIELKLSDKANAKLDSAKESIIVAAYVEGLPKDTTSEDYLEYGLISLANVQIELFDARIARFDHIKISREGYESLADKNFEVLINVFTGRRVFEDNLLDCEIVQEPVGTMKGKKYVLNGKLIYGE